jgi:hypothetical protein
LELRPFPFPFCVPESAPNFKKLGTTLLVTLLIIAMAPPMGGKKPLDWLAVLSPATLSS